MRRVKFLGQCLAVMAVGVLVANRALAEDNAVIKGKILFKGNKEDFKRKVLDTSKDPNCAKAAAKIGSEDVVLNTKSEPVTIRNVLLWVEGDPLNGRTFPKPTMPAVLNQEGCQYKPHVLAVMEGQEVVIKNSDDTNHNIHFLPKVNQEFNKTQPKIGMEDKVTLQAESVFPVKCDVHPWMKCHVSVFKHPYFAVTEDSGTYEIKGLPPGKYKLRAWHETFGEQSFDVEVASGASKEQDITFEPKK